MYRTNFEVRGHTPAKHIPDALAKICWDWVFDPKRQFKVPENKPSTCEVFPQTNVGNDAYVEAILSDDAGSLRWVLGLDHPDRTDTNIRWRTEIGIERTPSDRVFFSCSLYLFRVHRSVAPVRRASSRPKVVLNVLKQFQGHGELPLTSTPLLLKPEEKYIQAFLKLLQDSRRQHPVVFVSTHEQSERFLFDPGQLSDHLAGTAYVVVSENREACRMLAKQLPPQLRAVDGAVRLFWPGFTLRSNPFEHPLWTKERIMTIQTRSRNAFSRKLLNDIAAVAVTSVPDTLLTWTKLQEMHRRQAIANAKEHKDDKELLKLYTEDNDTLRVKVSGLEKELQSKGEELYRAQSRIAALENAMVETAPGNETMPVEFVADAIEQATAKWSNELVFSFNTKSDGENSPFQPASEVFQALEWLATVYHPARMGKLKVPNFDPHIREKIPGWNYAAHQSECAKGRFAEWYECQWDGRTYSITEHIGTGSSKRPEETIRICFAWDKTRSKIIIGYIGQHQKNTKS